jgi:hypothetical protein
MSSSSVTTKVLISSSSSFSRLLVSRSTSWKVRAVSSWSSYLPQSGVGRLANRTLWRRRIGRRVGRPKRHYMACPYRRQLPPSPPSPPRACRFPRLCTAAPDQVEQLHDGAAPLHVKRLRVQHCVQLEQREVAVLVVGGQTGGGLVRPGRGAAMAQGVGVRQPVLGEKGGEGKVEAAGRGSVGGGRDQSADGRNADGRNAVAESPEVLFPCLCP